MPGSEVYFLNAAVFLEPVGPPHWSPGFDATPAAAQVLITPVADTPSSSGQPYQRPALHFAFRGRYCSCTVVSSKHQTRQSERDFWGSDPLLRGGHGHGDDKGTQRQFLCISPLISEAVDSLLSADHTLASRLSPVPSVPSDWQDDSLMGVGSVRRPFMSWPVHLSRSISGGRDGGWMSRRLTPSSLRFPHLSSSSVCLFCARPASTLTGLAVLHVAPDIHPDAGPIIATISHRAF